MDIAVILGSGKHARDFRPMTIIVAKRPACAGDIARLRMNTPGEFVAIGINPGINNAHGHTQSRCAGAIGR
jgi:hypothetical protein